MNFTRTRNLSLGIGLVSLLSGGPLQAAAEELSLSFLDKNNFYLSSAGFKMQPANNPKAEKALRAIPPHRFVVHTVNGTERYLFADPKRCNCIFVGTKDNYLSYRAIQSQPLGSAPDDVAADYNKNVATVLSDPVGGNDIYDENSLSTFMQDF